MEFNGILNEIINNAKKDKKKIVLPESLDVRVLNACKICIEQDIADIILIGDEKLIKDTCNQNGIDIDFSKIKIENPLNSPLREKYINEFYELRKNKGISIDDARNIINDSVYFATMMVKMSDADGLVSGAVHSTADTLRPALQIIKAKNNVNTVSSFFLMETPDKTLGEYLYFQTVDLLSSQLKIN